ncbi:MAG: hypothetical protein ACPGXJ_08810 [Pseudomonadales bacterium]
MNHQIFAELLGNYGEFVGAIGVVVTLGYLAIQIKQNRTQTQTRIEQSLYEQWQSPAKIMADSPQLAEVFCRGQKSRAELSESEQMQFDMFCTLGINTVEFAYRLSEDADADPDSETWLSIALFFLNTPGGREFWQERRDLFFAEFCDWIETHTDVNSASFN